MGLAISSKVTKATKIDWIRAGMKLLVARGPQGLSVDSLCEQVGRTKGSFYHHFKNHEDFVDALAADWQQQNLHSPIENSKGDSGRARLATLTDITADLDPAQEMAMRQLASQHTKVHAILEQADSARIEYLALLYREAGLHPKQAKNAAKIQYAGFVGALYLWPKDFGAHVRKLGKIVDDLLVAAAR